MTEELTGNFSIVAVISSGVQRSREIYLGRSLRFALLQSR
jgi:hypothetical protein